MDKQRQLYNKIITTWKTQIRVELTNKSQSVHLTYLKVQVTGWLRTRSGESCRALEKRKHYQSSRTNPGKYTFILQADVCLVSNGTSSQKRGKVLNCISLHNCAGIIRNDPGQDCSARLHFTSPWRLLALLAFTKAAQASFASRALSSWLLVPTSSGKRQMVFLREHTQEVSSLEKMVSLKAHQRCICPLIWKGTGTSCYKPFGLFLVLLMQYSQPWAASSDRITSEDLFSD